MTLGKAQRAYRKALTADNEAAIEFAHAHTRKMETLKVLLDAKDDLREAEFEERENAVVQTIKLTPKMIVI